ncbi:cytidylate kinase-like family protein [Desulfonema ishimotonii]|uniref:Cytidylate kinase-like family protein n=1 Tax=Desulfonema ishimotonii TaxID=45657 RepID=A0A401FV18_9BACT|nr:cytidylate kinase-like family protein [Desulfonema ishimotonii]GBC60822.1 cytidylate kinase-like family protein [Desulfonema ishimotonii]
MAVITISRQFGAGGKTLGKVLAKKLGYELVDEDIIQMVADKANVSTDWVESTEKEAGGKLLKFMSGLISKSYVERILGDDKGYMDEEIYVNALRDVIQQVAKEDNVIVVGRGGQYVLQDHPGAFHVLLIADMADRITFMENHYDLSHEEAKRVVEQQGSRRANLYRKFGKEDYDLPNLYHVVLNMSKLDMDKASDFIFRMVSDVVCHLVE